MAAIAAEYEIPIPSPASIWAAASMANSVAAALSDRSDGKRRDRAEQELAKPEASRQEPDCERSDARREPGQGSQLAGSRHRDVQVARDVGEERIEHHERGLRRGAARPGA